MTKVLKLYQFLFVLNGQQLNITVLDEPDNVFYTLYLSAFGVSLLLFLKYYIPSKIVYLFRKQTAYATKSKECKFNRKREELY